MPCSLRDWAFDLAHRHCAIPLRELMNDVLTGGDARGEGEGGLADEGRHVLT